jgi:hypothetical protein
MLSQLVCTDINAAAESAAAGWLLDHAKEFLIKKGHDLSGRCIIMTFPAGTGTVGSSFRRRSSISLTGAPNDESLGDR